MRLPIQPKTVKPKINTKASMIQSRFTLASSVLRSRRHSPGIPSRHPRLELGRGRGETDAHEPARVRRGIDDLAVDLPGRIALRGRGHRDLDIAVDRRHVR